MSVRFCRECGARMSDTDKFCFNCGTPAASIPQSAPAAPAEPVPAAAVYVPELPEEPSMVQPTIAAEPAVIPEQPISEETQILEAPVFPAAPAEPSYAPPVYTEPSYAPPAYTPAAEPTYAPPVYPPFADPFADLDYPTPQESQAPTKSSKPPKAPKAPKEQKVAASVKPLPKRKFLNVLGCVLVCIFLVVLLLPAVLLVDVRMMADEDRILSILERVELDEIPAKDIFVDVDDDRTMLDWSCQYMNQNFSKTFNGTSYRWTELKPKSLQNFLDDTTFVDLTASTVAGLLNDVIEDTSKTALDASDIEDFLEDNSKFLTKEFKLELDRTTRQRIAEQTMSLLKMEELSLDELPESTQNVLQVASSVLSPVTLILLGVLVVLLIVLLFLISRKYIMAGIHDTGLVMLIAGSLLLVLTGAARLMCIFGAGKNGILYLIGVLAVGLLESGLLISACIFAFGILLLLISGITLSVLKKRAAKA